MDGRGRQQCADVFLSFKASAIDGDNGPNVKYTWKTGYISREEAEYSSFASEGAVVEAVYMCLPVECLTSDPPSYCRRRPRRFMLCSPVLVK